MKTAYLFISLIFLTASIAVAAGDSPEVRKALNILAGETVIPEKYTDAAYEQSPTELAWAFSIIAKSKNATELFQQLARSGSIYGLIGMAAHNKEAFEKACHRFRINSDIVVISQDTWQVFRADEFILKYLREDPKRWYDNLVFDAIPPWQDTVKVRDPVIEELKTERKK